MKKNLFSIFLLVGVVTLNLSMLCQASRVGRQDRQADAAYAAPAMAAERALAFAASHSTEREVKAGGESHAGHGCACGIDAQGLHFDLNFSAAAVELPPKGHAPQALSIAVSVFTDIASVPQDRPPKLFA